MKILVSALACNSPLGSESRVGWAAVQCLARDHELWVFTSPRNRQELERAQAAGEIGSNVHFLYAGQFKQWHPNRLRAQLQGWKEYISFTNEILPLAKELHQKVRFDLAHHLTLVSWRVPCQLWKLGLPLVFGPVGGNEQFPLRFLPILSPSAAAFEIARKVSNTISSLSPGVRACIRRSAHVFAANAETESLLIRLRGTRIGVSRMLAYFVPNASQPANENIRDKSIDGPLRLFAGGNLEGRKGIALSLRALARAKRSGVKFTYRYGGQGPEFHRIQKLVGELGLQQNVQLGEALRGKDYEDALKAAHIYLLPSLRDSAGITLAEAMLAGCVPIVADCGGPGQLVGEECGYKIPASNPESLINEIAKTIIHLDQNRDELRKKSPAAANRIATKFAEQSYRNTVNAVYRSVVQNKASHPAAD